MAASTAVPVSAADIPPPVSLGAAGVGVTYSLSAPPDTQDSGEQDGSGRDAEVVLSKGVATDQGAASATTKQRTTVNHGPTSVGYTVRTIRSVADVSGIATLEDEAAADTTVAATATSTTAFTVNSAVAYLIDNPTSLQIGDAAADCIRATVTLSTGSDVVFRETLQTPGTGCSSAPDDVGAETGNLRTGNYTLETSVTGAIAARGEYTVNMKGEMTSELSLGSGRTCDNVLPSSAGATLGGTVGSDTLCGGSGPDVIRGRDGNDTIVGGGGSDTLFGNAGNDNITPGGGSDEVSAGAGNDVVAACDGRRDTLRGQRGSDTVQHDRRDDISSFASKRAC